MIKKGLKMKKKKTINWMASRKTLRKEVRNPKVEIIST
jgi:hypothetical protein